MMSDKHISVKEVALNNNCPECYNKGLVLTFLQQVKDTKLYKSVTNKITHSLTCEVCHTTIYPVQWTEDIERVVAYQQKAFSPLKSSTYLKKTFWIIMALTLLVVVTLAVLVLYPN